MRVLIPTRITTRRITRRLSTERDLPRSTELLNDPPDTATRRMAGVAVTPGWALRGRRQSRRTMAVERPQTLPELLLECKDVEGDRGGAMPSTMAT